MKPVLLYFLLLNVLITKAQDSGEYFIYDGIKYHCLTDSTVEVALQHPNKWQKIGNYIADSALCHFEEHLSIPETISHKGVNYLVTEIADEAFHSKYSVSGVDSSTFLYTVLLPKSIKRIGDWAFYGNKKLKSINFPEGLESIGHSAFSFCEALEYINIPSTVISIGDGSFSCCSEPTIDFAQGGTSPLTISDGAFVGKADTLKIPERTVSIGKLAFWGVETDVLIIPSKLQHIGKNAFSSPPNTVLCYLEKPINADWSGTNVPSGVFGTYPIGPGWIWQPPVNLYLYVPDDAVEAYKANDFWYYVAGIFPLSAFDPSNCRPPSTRINTPQKEAEAKEVARYNSSGRRISSRQKGLNIVVMSNGETKKEYIK